MLNRVGEPYGRHTVVAHQQCDTSHTPVQVDSPTRSRSPRCGGHGPGHEGGWSEPEKN